MKDLHLYTEIRDTFRAFVFEADLPIVEAAEATAEIFSAFHGTFATSVLDHEVEKMLASSEDILADLGCH